MPPKPKPSLADRIQADREQRIQELESQPSRSWSEMAEYKRLVDQRTHAYSTMYSKEMIAGTVVVGGLAATGYGLATAPLATMGYLSTGYVVSEGVEAGAKVLGIPDAQAELLGLGAGFLAGPSLGKGGLKGLQKIFDISKSGFKDLGQYKFSFDPYTHYSGIPFPKVTKGSSEVIFKTSSYEQARNKALESLGKINSTTRKPVRCRLSSSKAYRKNVGFKFKDADGNLKVFRADWDPIKGCHINVEIGKGGSRIKQAYTFSGNEKSFLKIVKEFEKNGK